jgi:hypothetical protein
MPLIAGLPWLSPPESYGNPRLVVVAHVSHVIVEVRLMIAKSLPDNYGCMEYGKRVMFNML